MAGRRRMARIISGDDTTIVVDAAEPVANAYGNGLLRWLGGANGGCESAIAMSAGATLTLTAPPPFAADAGTMIELIEGCDKSFATFRQRFENVPNFGGEPFLPGIDLLTRFHGVCMAYL